MGSWATVAEMGKRVGLPNALTAEIFFIALGDAARRGLSQVDLVYMAHVIKYISVNAYHLKPKWRDMIQRMD